MNGDTIHLEICSACHPFYTGKQKLVDTAGRVDRFKERYKQIKGEQPEQAKSEQPEQAKGEQPEQAKGEQPEQAKGEQPEQAKAEDAK